MSTAAIARAQYYDDLNAVLARLPPKLKSGGAFTIERIEITGEGTKLHIQMDKGKKGKGKTGWISALDRAGNPTVQQAPELSRQTDNPVFETD